MMSIEGYRIYYLKKGDPIEKNGVDTELPMTLESIIVPAELKTSAEDLIRKNKDNVVSEEVISEWCKRNGISFGH